MEDNQQVKRESLRWQFWFSVAFSLFIIVTFALYLPQRFLYQIGKDTEAGMMTDGAGEHAGKALRSSQYHEEADIKEGIGVNLNATPAPFIAGAPLRLDFFVNQKPGNVPVPVGMLEIEHAKLMHVIGVRDDLNEFFHVHPRATSTPGLLSVNHIFSNPGFYKIWSEIKKDGIPHAFGHPEISVGGEGPRSQKSVNLARNVIVGDYQVGLRLPSTVVAKRDVELLFDAHTLDSHEIELEPYLAADMHLTLIKDDRKQFIHTHPEGGDHQGSMLINEASANGGGHDTSKAGHGVMFRVNFPEDGLYKAFVQFRPKGIDLPPDDALLAEFWIKVEESAPLFISEWWLYLIVSLILIAALSFGVNKFLRPGA